MDAYLERFLVGKFNESREVQDSKRLENIPNHIVDILNIINQKRSGGIIFFTDKNQILLPLLAFFFSVYKFSRDLPGLINKFSSLHLEVGDRIQVLPEGWVYEFRGAHKKYPHDFFIINVLDEPSSTRTIPKSEFLRFKKTSKDRPKGKLSGSFTDLEPTPIDFFLPGMSIFGNDDILEIQTLILAKKAFIQHSFSTFGSRSKSAFSEYDEIVNTFIRFLDISPIGTISEEGEILSTDRNVNTKKPLIATSQSIDDLFYTVRKQELKEKLILIDGIKDLDIDPNYLDYALENNTVCVLASRDELFSVHNYLEKFEINIPQEEEILQETNKSEINRRAPIGKLLSMAANRNELHIYFKFCELKELDELYEKFREMLIKYRRHNDEIDQIFLTLHGLLFDLGECFEVNENYLKKLEFLERKLSELSEDNVEPSKQIQEIIDGVYSIFESLQKFGSPKLQALLSELKESEDANTLLLVRSNQAVENLQRVVKSRNIVRTYNSFASESSGNFKKIICLGWPNSKRFGKFWHQHLSKEIHFIGYVFENHRFKRFLSSYDGLHARLIRGSTDPEWFAKGTFRLLNKIQVYDDPTQLEELKSDDIGEDNLEESQNKELESLIRRIESRALNNNTYIYDEEDVMLDAKLINFAGGEAYSWFTEGHKVHVLDELFIDNSEKISIRSIEELDEGNLILFRDQGDKDFLRMIAQDAIGRNEYDLHLKRSGEWKLALSTLGESLKQINAVLRKSGLNKNAGTISQWLHNDELIGPRDLEEISKILSLVTDNTQYSRAEDIVQSIEIVRSSHHSAGFELTKLIIEEIKSNPPDLSQSINEINLNLGTVWIAEIEKIHNQIESIGASNLNRLLFTEYHE